MLGWWRRLWRLWRCKDRQLFCYWDGRRWIRADPLPLVRQFLASKIQELADDFDNHQEPGATQFIEEICRIFSLMRYDPKTGLGLTDQEVVGVLGQFGTYLEEIKKKVTAGPS